MCHITKFYKMAHLKTRLIVIITIFLIITNDNIAYSQGTVGINTTTPEGVLDVVSSNSAIILPRNSNPATNVVLPKAGMIIYNSTNKYIQYFDGTVWKNPQLEPWMVSGTSTQAELNTQNIYQTGNVGIGINIPTNKLHISDLNNPVRIQGLSSGVTSDSLVSIDANGIVKRRSVYSLRKDIVAPPTAGETPFKGMIRFNTTTNTLEYYDGTIWEAIASNSFGGRNEGVVRIDGSNGNTNDKPVIAFTNADLNIYKYINYTTPLARPFAFWPENITPPITDANIVRTYNSNTTFVENSIIGQVHTWRINATFADKPSGTGGFITIRFTNPISGFILQQYVPCQTNTTSANFTVNFITVADQASLPAPLGTGSGYNILITTDVRLTITIQSITRVSAYKD